MSQCHKLRCFTTNIFPTPNFYKQGGAYLSSLVDLPLKNSLGLKCLQCQTLTFHHLTETKAQRYPGTSIFLWPTQLFCPTNLSFRDLTKRPSTVALLRQSVNSSRQKCFVALTPVAKFALKYQLLQLDGFSDQLDVTLFLHCCAFHHLVQAQYCRYHNLFCNAVSYSGVPRHSGQLYST